MFINEPSVVSYVVVSGVTEFPFGFKWYNDSDIVVYLVPVGEVPDDTLHKLIPSEYVVTSNASKVGGTVTISVTLADGDRVTVSRVLPVTRTVDYATRGNFNATTVNDDQDYQTYLALDLASYSNLFLRQPVSSGVADTLIFPPFVANGVIRYNETGELIADPELHVLVDEAEGYRDEAEAFSEQSELEAWDAEAEALSAQSNATEPVGVFVRDFASNGDGTFTATNTTRFSALHYASVSGSALSLVGFWDASVETTVPPDGSAGEFWIISGAGDLDGLPYLIKDELHWDDNTTQWLKLPNVSDWASILNVSVDGRSPISGDDLALSSSAVPIGGMIPYSGLIANIPSNWELVSELNDKMILGTVTEAEIGTTGGSNDALLNTHSHINTATTDTVSLTGSFSAKDNDNTSTYVRVDNVSGICSLTSGTVTMMNQGGDSTTGGYAVNIDASHGHTVTMTNGEAGTSDGIGANVPAFIKFAWIRRVS